MTMQERTRYEEAGAALHAMGHRVTAKRLDRWLRERDGRGLSLRDAMPVVKRYRELSHPRISGTVQSCVELLDRLDGWERHEVLRILRKAYPRVNP